MKKYSVLFVCTGNICRSPTADGVMRKLVQQAGLAAEIEVDSAGTIDHHAGESPDQRARHHAGRRGYDLSTLKARHLAAEDFHRFDLILAMDRSHLALLGRHCPPEKKSSLRLLMEFARESSHPEVPDPYYGGDEGFEHVLNLVEDACSGLLEHVREQLAPA